MEKTGKKKIPRKIISAILCVLTVICIVPLVGCNNNETAEPPEVKPGYSHAVYERTAEKGASFLVCGTGGRLDRIFEDGTVENIPLPVGDKNLTAVLVGEEITLVGGEEGALVYSRDGKKFELSSGAENEYILGLAQFNGKYFACTFSGKILSSDDGVSWEAGSPMADKPIIAIAAAGSCLLAITEDTNIFKSEDGVNWDSQNYNEVYDGLAEKQSFLNMVNLNQRIFILGHPDGDRETPSVMHSDDGGELWRYVSSSKINDLIPEEFYPLTTYSVAYFGGVMLAACDRGRILIYTDCPSCNELMETENADLRCIAVSEKSVLVAGDNFDFTVLTEEDFQEFSSFNGETQGDSLE